MPKTVQRTAASRFAQRRIQRHRRLASIGDLMAAPMNILRTYFGKFATGILFLNAVAAAQAQSTWNYFISDAGGGNSLLTWNVSGSLANPPGATLTTFQTSIAISINAPGI